MPLCLYPVVWLVICLFCVCACLCITVFYGNSGCERYRKILPFVNCAHTTKSPSTGRERRTKKDDFLQSKFPKTSKEKKGICKCLTIVLLVKALI